MNKKILNSDYTAIAKEFAVTVPDVKTIVAVESGGHGFDPSTGKIIIQFEPGWFKRKAVKEYNEYLRIKKIYDTAKANNKPLNLTAIEQTHFKNFQTILDNGVRNQAAEWLVFNVAFAMNAQAAMESTSIGLMQVMGFHWKILGFSSVGAMWDYAKSSEANQVRLGLRFIKLNPKMYAALRDHDWPVFAYYYNGPKYKNFKYDTRLEAAYQKFKN